MTARVRELLAIMERLRGADGCPWDRAQSFASIAPYTIEEAYEVADAIDRGDMPHLKDELGDLLFQVVFHAQMARESGQFDFDAVAAAICDKLKRRHPHVFGGAAPDSPAPADAAAQLVSWEDIKARERAAAAPAAGAGAAPAPSALDGVPAALPALLRAHKLSKRAARVGFDFAHARETADKVAEELAEVREAAGAGSGKPRRRRSSRRWAICCSQRPTWPASSRSTRRRPCGPPTASSSAAFAAWSASPRNAAHGSRTWISRRRRRCGKKSSVENEARIEAARGAAQLVFKRDAGLPIFARRAEIAEALRLNQVVIVAGDTGSGKSTQLPQICLELGRGILGLIAHTQPRRIAARALAARIAEELSQPLGASVGYRVRFADRVSASTGWC